MNAQALVLTDNAANKVRQLRDSEGNQDLMLRVYVTGGGCSGFSYGFNFAESQNEDDAEFANGDVKVLVDSLSYQYLVGSRSEEHTSELQSRENIVCRLLLEKK